MFREYEALAENLAVFPNSSAQLQCYGFGNSSTVIVFKKDLASDFVSDCFKLVCKRMKALWIALWFRLVALLNRRNAAKKL